MTMSGSTSRTGTGGRNPAGTDAQPDGLSARVTVIGAGMSRTCTAAKLQVVRPSAHRDVVVAAFPVQVPSG